MKNYIQELTTDKINNLCYDLHLGDFDHAELIKQKIGETYFNQSGTNPPPKGIPLIYAFSNHGLVNSGIAGQFVCENFDEYEMIEHQPASIHINQFFMRFMSNNFPNYIDDEIAHREENIKNLVHVIKQNTEIIDSLQEKLTQKTTKLNNLSDEEFDDAAHTLTNLGKMIQCLEHNVYRQYKEALYHDTMLRLTVQEIGKDPNTINPLNSRFGEDFDIELYKPDTEIMIEDNDEDEDDDEKIAYNDDIDPFDSEYPSHHDACNYTYEEDSDNTDEDEFSL